MMPTPLPAPSEQFFYQHHGGQSVRLKQDDSEAEERQTRIGLPVRPGHIETTPTTCTPATIAPRRLLDSLDGLIYAEEAWSIHLKPDEVLCGHRIRAFCRSLSLCPDLA